MTIASLSPKGTTQEELDASLSDEVLHMIGWEHMSEQDKAKVVDEAHNLLLSKTKTLLRNNRNLKARVHALHNTAVQCNRKAKLLEGQANSLMNTARNLENRIIEDEARIMQCTRASIILKAVHDNSA